MYLLIFILGMIMGIVGITMFACLAVGDDDDRSNDGCCRNCDLWRNRNQVHTEKPGLLEDKDGDDGK